MRRDEERGGEKKRSREREREGGREREKRREGVGEGRGEREWERDSGVTASSGMGRRSRAVSLGWLGVPGRGSE